uniref:NADH-ubiquinone oxidoreductase chain 4 n=1 Tax=Ophiopholis mirabilis TaxID=2705304 RepID=A0A6C0FCU3_9ECHI|nr:NADH dehydrogenase subunit 4 [Ophiopholis mirabilis]QHT54267.1 NADH dehydrogenase subunit 4 [Ophiopholis mirabilis]
MLTLLSTILATIITVIIAPKNKTWPIVVAFTSFILILGTIWTTSISITQNPTWGLLIDNISGPLIGLSVWLIPVALMANISNLQTNSAEESRNFILLVLLILIFLTFTFSSNSFIGLFLGFEGTLIPTLFLITRWGAQQERIEAGLYFVFYTLISSLPLFLSLLYIYKANNHLSINLSLINSLGSISNTAAVFCMIAFLVKVPIFSLHLWLPKAHVEAPVAGSMILAAILLKMGGYGFIRLTSLFYLPFNTNISSMLIPFCCWGGLLTGLICLTQSDLKSLIAYSSVSHMSFMIAGISVLTSWAFAGGMVVMIAHGIVSSALFCLANTFYERTSTRTLIVSRGIKSMFATLPLVWLVFAAANMGLPPLPNSVGETFIISAIVSHNIINFLPTLLGVAVTAIFSLTVYQLLNSGANQKWNINATKINEREYTTIALHFLPLLALILSPEIVAS